MLIPVALTRQDYAYGFRTVLPHRPNLTGGRMCTQHHPFVHPEGVPHVACRMVRRHIEQAEVQFVGLHLRSLVHLKPHTSENLIDPTQSLCRDVQVAIFAWSPWEGDINGALRELLLQLRAF